MTENNEGQLSRRNFLKVSGLVLAAGFFAVPESSESEGKIGDCSTCINSKEDRCPYIKGKLSKDKFGVCANYEVNSDNWADMYAESYGVWPSAISA